MRRFVGVIGAVCAVVAVAVPQSGAYTVPKPCKVPKTAGTTLIAAENAITAAHCTVGNITAQQSSTVAKGKVISTSPAAGSTGAMGEPVDITVSLGKPSSGAKCVVPKVVKKTLASAEEALVKANCGVGTVTKVFSKHVGKGKVISQSKAPGTTGAVGTKVNLTVSKGKKH